ncbi:MAG: alpha/beta hydrolase [Rudaea sp.]
MSPGARLSAMMLVAAASVLSSGGVFAARSAYREIVQARDRGDLEDVGGGGSDARSALPAGARVLRDVAYGSDPAQKFDVYVPAGAKAAAVIFMVHGGGWTRGDKGMARVVDEKVRRWLPRRFIFITTNYRMVPAVSVETEARDLAAAVAFAQRHAREWGGDARKFVLMGHSAGAHLVALLDSAPTIATKAGAAPWLGSVLLDSGALDVTAIMRDRHFALYDRAFGQDPAQWKAVSPLAQLAQRGAPILAICSARRANSCDQAQAYVDKAVSFGTRASVRRENRSHGEINADLGKPGPYTDAVETFLRSLGLSIGDDSAAPAGGAQRP